MGKSSLSQEDSGLIFLSRSYKKTKGLPLIHSLKKSPSSAKTKYDEIGQLLSTYEQLKPEASYKVVGREVDGGVETATYEETTYIDDSLAWAHGGHFGHVEPNLFADVLEERNFRATPFSLNSLLMLTAGTHFRQLPWIPNSQRVFGS